MRIFKYPKSFILYITIWMLYLMQGAIWGEGTIISQMLLVFLLLFSIVYFIKAIKKWSILPRSLKGLIILLISYVIYGGFAIINGKTLYVSHSGTEIPPFAYLKQALVSILPLFTFFYYGLRNQLSTKLLCILSVIFLGVIIISFFTEQTKMLTLALERGSSLTEFTNNASYEFIYLVPYLYLFKNKKVSISILMCIIIFLLLGMKRGAILIGIIVISIYLKDLFSKSSHNQKVLLISCSVILSICLGFFIYNIYESSSLFQDRIESTLNGYTSGRDDISKSLMHYYFYQASIIQMIFGSGANATLLHSINFAHNDWLEMLIDQGLVGFILLFTFYLLFWLDIRRLNKYNKLFFHSFRTLFIISFLKTFFSMSICSMLPYTTLLMGYYMALLVLYKTKNINI